MGRLFTAAACAAVAAFVGSSSLAVAQQRNAKPCAEVRGASGVAKRSPCRDGDNPSRPAAATGNIAGDRPVYSSVKELMESIIDPSADVLWGAVGTVVDKEGTHEMLPKTQEEWLDVRRAAVRIIEGSNLLMMPGRDAAPAGTKSEVPGVELEPAQMTALIRKNRRTFDAFARELQVLGVEASKASDTQNGMLLMDIGARMEDVCEGCHRTFWYPPPERPSTRN
jgi:hypothetical protein